MISELEKQELAKKFKITQTMWTALLALLGILVAGAYLAPQFVQLLPVNASADSLRIITLVVYLMAVTELAVCLFIRQSILKSKTNPTLKGVNLADQTPVYLAGAAYNAATVITGGLCLSVGLYGAILFLITRRVDHLLVLGFVGAAGMVFFRPKLTELHALYEAKQKSV